MLIYIRDSASDYCNATRSKPSSSTYRSCISSDHKEYIYSSQLKSTESECYYNSNSEVLMADTIDGIYFMNGNNMCFIYYMDKEGREAVPLCDNLECSHTSTDCKACLGSFGEDAPLITVEELKIYNNNIYYVTATKLKEGV